jgi:hypothetical protein
MADSTQGRINFSSAWTRRLADCVLVGRGVNRLGGIAFRAVEHSMAGIKGELPRGPVG